MSELITPHRTDFRWQLLTTVSMLAIAGAVSGYAKASDTDRPTVWIELGAQMEQIDGGQEQFVPPFIANSPRASVWSPSPLVAEQLARHAIGGEGKITFAPEGSNWIFTASARYGRSNANKSVAQQSDIPTFFIIPTEPALGEVHPVLKLSDQANGKNSESHTILDFMAGRDVGLGLFGGKSTVSLGVRIAQFHSQSDVAMKSRPTLGNVMLKSLFGGAVHIMYYYPHNFMASADSERSFHSIGPSISWDASAPIGGNADTEQLTLDWGFNAAVLFGRQKARVHHQTSGRYVQQTDVAQTKYKILSSYHHPHARTRSRSVIVPNVGGFAGVSFKFPNAKISMGYRADFFFNAMDGGLDTSKSYNRNFYGPFATISIGLGG